MDDLKTKAAEFANKLLTLGVGTLFLTEESLRTLVKEIRLPKETINSVLASAAKTRKEFFQNLSSEVIDRIETRFDSKKLIEDVLKDYDFEFKVKVRIVPKN